ncbi:uncharacterized protein DS421_19g667440 [Arachis hypogaea]|uniref:Uncharacterized protein n=1 Tax=Arachis hypogaea TaxID=3818 RepID=A0A6B9VC23_ARAHY|nr:uncharacterized protein DS421_19g667440 [Arachis hypogaea]
MAKNNGMRDAIAILAIGIVVFSVIGESYKSILEGPWISSYNIASTLNICIEQCRQQYSYSHEKRQTCIMSCCVSECHLLEPTDPKRFRICVEKLYAKYVHVKD